MQQFLDREKRKAYINGHIEMLDGCKATKCTYPRRKCVDAFPSVLEMKFHLQDVHCIEFTRGQTKYYDADVKLDSWPQFLYEFVDETTKLCGQHATGTLTPPSISSDRSSPWNTSTTDEITDVTETPASSMCTDIFDKLDPRFLDE